MGVLGNKRRQITSASVRETDLPSVGIASGRGRGRRWVLVASVVSTAVVVVASVVAIVVVVVLAVVASIVIGGRLVTGVVLRLVTVFSRRCRRGGRGRSVRILNWSRWFSRGRPGLAASG